MSDDGTNGPVLGTPQGEPDTTTAAAFNEASNASLSPRDRAALDRTRGTWLPLVFVLLSLALAVLLPQLSQRRITALRNEVNLYADPARQRVATIQLYLTRGIAQRRAYAFSHDSALIANLQSSRIRREDAERELVRFTRALDGTDLPRLEPFALRLEQFDHALDSTVGTLDLTRRPAGAIPAIQTGYSQIQATADTLGLALDSAIAVRHRMVDRIEMIAAPLTSLVVLLGLGAAFLVARLGMRYRGLAIRLDEQAARFRQIAENLGDVVWLSEPGFRRHLYVNRAYERIWGRSRESLGENPDSFIDSVHPADQARVRAALVSLAEDFTDIEFRVVRPNGEVRWVWNRSFPVRNAAGKVFRITGIIEDITDERRHAAEREELLRKEREAREIAERRQLELEHVMESRVRLIRGFTHDVKNPLGAADGYLAMLEEGALGVVPPKHEETLTNVRRLIGHALALIHKLLDVARAEAGQLDVHEEPTEVPSIVRDVVESFRAQARAKNIRLDLELDQHIPIVRTDPALVRQVIGNLVSNAVKYTRDDGRVCIEVRLEEAPNDGVRHATVIVADNGPGIAPEKLPLLFIEFTRFDASAAEGAGIGLAISQKIAEALGGSISVDNRPNRGCTFVLRLPVSGPARAAA
jgi:PAS domain S-box-containing protein